MCIINFINNYTYMSIASVFAVWPTVKLVIVFLPKHANIIRHAFIYKYSV